MLFLTASAAAQPDYVALAMVIAMAVVVAIMTLRKYLSKKNPSQKLPVPASAPAAPAQEAPKPTAPGSAGMLKLHDVEPKTAAMLMAIVADKLGKPLNELRFISIKEVK